MRTTTTSSRCNNIVKPKISKEERRAKYTQIAKERRAKQVKRERSRNLVCFKCREKGHTSSDCGKTAILCYKCGSQDHSLKDCSAYEKDDQELPFAACYTCHEMGHLASTCPKNPRGIYVHGGSCRKCGSIRHILAQCPENDSSRSAKKDKLQLNNLDEVWEETIHTMGKQPMKSSQAEKKTPKVVSF